MGQSDECTSDFCHLYIYYCLYVIFCGIVFGQLYPPGQVTYYDHHCGSLVKWWTIIVWPLSTLPHHTCLPGHSNSDDYKYMDGHTAIIVTDSVSRGTVAAIFVTFMIKIYFQKLPTDYHHFVPLGINVKSMFIYYNLYKFIIFTF